MATQNVTLPALGPRILDLLEHDRMASDAALAHALSASEWSEYRQVTVIDSGERTALFTGQQALGLHRAVAGDQCVAAGNMLADRNVIDAIVLAFERTPGALADRLLRAMHAAVEAGGEAGPVHSAARSRSSMRRCGLLSICEWIGRTKIRSASSMRCGARTSPRCRITSCARWIRRPRRATESQVMNDTSSRWLLEQLIGFPTVSRDSNLELIAFIRQYLADLGVASEVFHNDERTKASLFATIGPGDRGGVVLSGHTDVVPVDGQAWTVDPFRLTEQGGRLYGRGTADMKGYIASVLGAVPHFLACDLHLPVHLAFSYDEEVGCLGVRPMLAEIARRPHRPRLCLIGEPTGLEPVLGHKGKLAMRCHVKGAACHSAYAPQGVNAIQYAARLISRLEAIGEDLARPEFHDHRFDPPFSTVQTGVIRGGRALNIVPAECEFDFEVRAVPGFDARSVAEDLQSYVDAEVLPKMRAVRPDTDILLQPLNDYPGLATDPQSEAADLLALLCGSNEFGTVAFGTEGGLYTQAGIATVVCGPGSMDQGHKPDEFVTIEQLSRCDAMLRRLAAELSKAER